MSRYTEASRSGGLTLGELRHFLQVVDAMNFPEGTKVRARVGFTGTHGARLKDISIDDKDRPEEQA